VGLGFFFILFCGKIHIALRDFSGGAVVFSFLFKGRALFDWTRLTAAIQFPFAIPSFEKTEASLAQAVMDTPCSSRPVPV